MPLAGAKVRASDIREVTVISKAAGESLTSVAVSQNDDDIAIALDVGVYVIDLFAAVTGATAADVKMKWTNTGTMTLRHRSGLAPTSGTADATATSMRAQAGLSLANEPAYGTDNTNSGRIHEHLLVEVTVAGTITFQWAQNTSTASATTMTTQTHALYQRVTDG